MFLKNRRSSRGSRTIRNRRSHTAGANYGTLERRRLLAGTSLCLTGTTCSPGLFTMRGRRPGESLFHWDIAPGLWFRQVTPDVELTNLQNCLGVRRIASMAKPEACRRE